MSSSSQPGNALPQDPLARGLGVFSLALGIPQTLMPGRMSRMIGVKDDAKSRMLMRAVGVRELAGGVGIFTDRRPARWVWARVAADAMDLALLGSALRNRSRSQTRTLAATGAVVGALAADVVVGIRLSRSPNGDAGGEGQGEPEAPVQVTAAMTIRRDRDELYSLWRDFESFPDFMIHLEEVRTTGEKTSHWKARGPLGMTVEWDAEITEEVPGSGSRGARSPDRRSTTRAPSGSSRRPATRAPRSTSTCATTRLRERSARRSRRSSAGAGDPAQGRRPRCRSVPDRLRQLQRVHPGPVLAVRELQPQRADRREAVRKHDVRHIRLLPCHRRLRRRPGGVRAGAVRRHGADQDRERPVRRAGPLPVRRLPTGYMGAEVCDIKPGDVVAVWGCGPVGLFAIASAYLLGAERVIAIDRFDPRLRMAHEKARAETINYEQTSVREALREMTGGRGPDACIDCVGLEAHHHHGGMYAYDRVKQATRLQTERGYALREAIFNCRSGGTVSIGYETFKHEQDECVKVVMKP